MRDIDDLHDTLSRLQEDLREIRRGDYDPPHGMHLTGSSYGMATPDDIVEELKEANGHLGEISTMLWLLGLQMYDGNWNEDVQRLKPSSK